MAENACYGCIDEQLDYDHYHQYINAFGDATSCWFVDGKVFRNVSDLLVYLEETLECTTDEGMRFVHTLTKRYN